MRAGSNLAVGEREHAGSVFRLAVDLAPPAVAGRASRTLRWWSPRGAVPRRPGQSRPMMRAEADGRLLVDGTPGLRRGPDGVERHGRPPAAGDRALRERGRRGRGDPLRPRARPRDRRALRRAQRARPLRPGRRADDRPDPDGRRARGSGAPSRVGAGRGAARRARSRRDGAWADHDRGQRVPHRRRRADARRRDGLARAPARAVVRQRGVVRADHRRGRAAPRRRGRQPGAVLGPARRRRQLRRRVRVRVPAAPGRQPGACRRALLRASRMRPRCCAAGGT